MRVLRLPAAFDFGNDVELIQTDYGGMFTDPRFAQYARTSGLRLNTTSPNQSSPYIVDQVIISIAKCLVHICALPTAPRYGGIQRQLSPFTWRLGPATTMQISDRSVLYNISTMRPTGTGSPVSLCDKELPRSTEPAITEVMASGSVPPATAQTNGHNMHSHNSMPETRLPSNNPDADIQTESSEAGRPSTVIAVGSEDDCAACRRRRQAHTCGRACKNNSPESQNTETSKDIDALGDLATDVVTLPKKDRSLFQNVRTEMNPLILRLETVSS